MKSTHLLTLTAALLVAGSAFAGPNCKKCPSKDGASEEGVYEVAERDGDAKPEKRERGEKGERGERKRRGHHPLRGLDLTDDQKEQVKEIMAAAREQAKAIMEDAKAKKQAGEEIDRKAIRTQMMEIRKGAMKNVYDNVLTEEQQTKIDEHRKKMEERRAEREKNREGKDGERPERERKGKGDKKDRGGDEDLDL